jgi:DinB superfamily
MWSALEYACHVRDVLLVMRERVLRVLREPSPPAFSPMGRDERVRDDRYAEQAPDGVARQITDAAGMLAFVFEGLDEAQWAKPCVYGYPTPAERTLSWVAQQTLHELDQHLWDLRNSLVSAP